MKNKLNKLLTFIFASLLFISRVDAIDPGDKIKVEKDGSTWKVVKVDPVTDKNLEYCDINKPSNPNKLKITAKEFPTIGYTYENVCKKGHWITEVFYTKASMDTSILYSSYTPGDLGCADGDQSCINYEVGEHGKNATDFTARVTGTLNEQGSDIPNRTGSKFSENLKLLSNITNSNIKNYNIKKLKWYTDKLSGEVYNPDSINGYYAGVNAKMEKKGYFVSYYLGCFGTKYLDCYYPRYHEECYEASNGKTYCESYVNYENVPAESERLRKYNYPDPNNTDPVKGANALKDFINEIPDPVCNGAYAGALHNDAYCSGTYYRAPIVTRKFICTEVGPSKVEVYGYDLSINGKDAYCVTPSAGYNKSYFWDNRFDASMCKNSLQMYNKDGSTSYNLDCGFAYIMAEGKRLNSEAGKEIFNYGVISTAMKIFGTGIIGNKDENGNQLFLTDLINDAISNNKFLQAAGYYTTYYAWGYGEYVGIPWVRDGIDRSGWPSLYGYFLPDFYSIYIHTANVAGRYLINNDTKKIRFSDIGNIKDENGNYITDPFYYLEPKACKETFKNCTQSSTKVQYNDPLSQGIVGSNLPNDGSLLEWLQTGGVKSTCKDTSGLGVLCGTKDEKGNADYIKAIYLYMRALQGNELIFEKKVAQSIDQYSPVNGQTKVIYEVDDQGNSTAVIRYAIDSKISSETVTGEVEVDCDWTNEATKDYCKAHVFVFDDQGRQIYDTDHYDYCKKNYCYVQIKSSMICDGERSSSKLSTVVVTDPGLKSTTIKKIVSGISTEQTIFVYDDEGKISGGFCQEITAVQEDVNYKCPCDPKKNANVVESNGNIEKVNYCSGNYDAYDQLYYGDASMSTILNACYDEDKLKYDFTDEYNINGNNIVYDAELKSKYSFQVKSDDFGVCKLYCRDESRFYIANKISVKAGQHLKYDIGQILIDKKLINDTAHDQGINDTNDPRNELHNYMPSVVLQFRECTSEIDYNKWKNLYSKAGNDNRLKTQLLYSIYNCNLYTTDEINKALRKTIATNSETNYSKLQNYAEPAMIEYKYHTDTGNISVEKIYGTTKEYLLTQEGCTSLGLSQTDCASYLFKGYNEYTKTTDSEISSKEKYSYYNTLGTTFDFEHGLVDSNLNDTIYCNGDSCYKIKGVDGKYYYNPKALNKNDYTTVDDIYSNGKIIKHESGKILDYQSWGLNHEDYNKYSDKYLTDVVGNYKVPKNKYASFIVVTETGFYNKKQYYTDSYSGLIKEKENDNLSIKSVELERNIFPLHVDIETGSYEVRHSYENTRTAYKRSKYYDEKNYTLFDNINRKPGTFDYICSYDAYNTTTKYEKSLGFVYRMVNLNDVFESVSDGSRKLPENWATSFGQKTLDQIHASSSNILEHDNDNDEVASYLEYSYTLTPEGINRIRQWNSLNEKSNGYLDNTTYGCEYDEEEGIFYNCKSSFLGVLNSLNGQFEGLIKVNKGDGISEFCLDKHNENQDYCKYQHKSSYGLNDISDEVNDESIDLITGGVN